MKTDIANLYNDPLKFVYYVFPWGDAKTVLADEDGPDTWQIDVLTTISTKLQETDALTDKEVLTAAIRIAVASGHGIGKTALVSWIILWFISTRDHPQIVVTANTLNQLTNKTWRELAKWKKLAIHGDWFEWTATKFYLKGEPETWFASAIPWSEHNSEAFAGTHEKHVLVIFDEASGISDTMPRRMHLPTRKCLPQRYA